MNTTDPQFPPRDRLFALIASIPGSGTVDWCSPARALLDEIAAAVPAAVPPTADRAALRDRIITALDNAHTTHPCPALGDQYWSGCVHYDEAGRMVGVGSCHSGRRADAVLSVLTASSDRADVLETENARMRHELEVMYGGAFDSLKDASSDRAAEWRAAAVFVEAMNEGCGQAKPCASCDAREDAAAELRRMAGETPQPARDATILTELQQHLTDHTPSCNARTDHLMRRAAWALGAPRPVHVGGNAEKCPGCEGSNPPYPFICPGPDAVEAQAGCGCPSEDVPEHMFGGENCDCIPFTRQGGTPRYCGPTDTVDMISGWEIGSNCPHHKAAVEAPPGKEA